MAMSARKMMAIGSVLGIAVGALAVVASFSGANLFHGGHLNPVANVLLPGLAIAERLPHGTPGFAFAALVLVSLLQFPLYGALAGHYCASRRLVPLAKALFAIHAVAVLIAVAGTLLAGYR